MTVSEALNFRGSGARTKARRANAEAWRESAPAAQAERWRNSRRFMGASNFNAGCKYSPHPVADGRDRLPIISTFGSDVRLSRPERGSSDEQAWPANRDQAFAVSP